MSAYRDTVNIRGAEHAVANTPVGVAGRDGRDKWIYPRTSSKLGECALHTRVVRAVGGTRKRCDTQSRRGPFESACWREQDSVFLPLLASSRLVSFLGSADRGSIVHQRRPGGSARSSEKPRREYAVLQETPQIFSPQK